MQQLSVSEFLKVSDFQLHDRGRKLRTRARKAVISAEVVERDQWPVALHHVDVRPVGNALTGSDVVASKRMLKSLQRTRSVVGVGEGARPLG